MLNLVTWISGNLITAVDEILFTAISFKAQKIDIPRVEINTISRDYHIDAMIKFGRAIGMDIKDSKPESEEEISRGWVGDVREILLLKINAFE